MRILILRGGALGDFLVTLPALGLLRTKWPSARIELVGHAHAAGLGVSGGCLDAVHSQHEARWSALFSVAAAELPSALHAWLAEFDLIVNYWPDPDGTLARRFPLRAGQQFLSAPAAPTLAPAARHFCEPLKALGLSTADFRSRLRLPTGNDVAFLTSDPRLPVAIHPGSGSPRKNWPRERWTELMARLEEPILLVLGEVEMEWLPICSSLLAGDRPAPLTAIGSPASRLLHPRVQLAHNLPLPELAAALARCRLFLGHDSGVSHLAAAVGTPCVLLFGPTDPAMWAPPGDHVRVLRHGESMDTIAVDEVTAAAIWRRCENHPQPTLSCHVNY
jgi:heptosyltransferase-2